MKKKKKKLRNKIKVDNFFIARALTLHSLSFSHSLAPSQNHSKSQTKTHTHIRCVKKCWCDCVARIAKFLRLFSYLLFLFLLLHAVVLEFVTFSLSLRVCISVSRGSFTIPKRREMKRNETKKQTNKHKQHTNLPLRISI